MGSATGEGTKAEVQTLQKNNIDGDVRNTRGSDPAASNGGRV